MSFLTIRQVLHLGLQALISALVGDEWVTERLFRLTAYGMPPFTYLAVGRRACLYIVA